MLQGEFRDYDEAGGREGVEAAAELVAGGAAAAAVILSSDPISGRFGVLIISAAPCRSLSPFYTSRISPLSTMATTTPEITLYSAKIW